MAWRDEIAEREGGRAGISRAPIFSPAKALVPVCSVAVLYFVWRFLARSGLADPDSLKLVLWTVPPVLLAWISIRGSFWDVLAGVGVRPPFFLALLPGLLGGAVMAFILLRAGASPVSLSFETIFDRAVEPAVSEEFLFRGFLLTALLASGARSWAAVLLCGALFGAIHIPNVWASGDASLIAAEVAVTGFGGVLFALLMLIMRGSVIAPMALHGGLNFVWELFAVSETAIGDQRAFLARGAALIAAFVAALVLRRAFKW